ncbi:MAG: hypothetical protein K2W94_04175 [Alphaproteobacteria bacterium]|nr:hypothetical protein [Alphaproteobacteria bacterium]
MTKAILFFFLFCGIIVAMEDDGSKETPSLRQSRRVTFAAGVESPKGNEELRAQQKMALKAHREQVAAAFKQKLEDAIPKDVKLDSRKSKKATSKLRNIQDQTFAKGLSYREEEGSRGLGFSNLKIAAVQEATSKDHDESSQMASSKVEIPTEKSDWSD